MEERAIHISSINREKRGTSRPGDFTIKFNPSLKLNPDMKHELALDRLSMNYSWYNIRSDYGNNKIIYTHNGSTWQTISFTITDSIVNGINTNTIAVIPTDNLTRSFPFMFEPKRPLYCPVSTFHIDEMRIYVTDSLGRPVNFNGIDWFMTLILHSM